MKTNKSLRIMQLDFSCMVEYVGAISITENNGGVGNQYRLTMNKNQRTDELFWDWLQDQQGVNLDGSYNSKSGYYNRVIIIFSIREDRKGKSTAASRAIAYAFQYISEMYNLFIKECSDDL